MNYMLTLTREELDLVCLAVGFYAGDSLRTASTAEERARARRLLELGSGIANRATAAITEAYAPACPHTSWSTHTGGDPFDECEKCGAWRMPHRGIKEWRAKE